MWKLRPETCSRSSLQVAAWMWSGGWKTRAGRTKVTSNLHTGATLTYVPRETAGGRLCLLLLETGATDSFYGKTSLCRNWKKKKKKRTLMTENIRKLLCFQHVTQLQSYLQRCVSRLVQLHIRVELNQVCFSLFVLCMNVDQWSFLYSQTGERKKMMLRNWIAHVFSWREQLWRAGGVIGRPVGVWRVEGWLML